MRLWTTWILCSCLFAPLQALCAIDHQPWSLVLKRYVNDEGYVRYRQLKADLAKSDPHPLQTYLKAIQSVSAQEFEAWTQNEQKAFLINSYNALTVRLILDHYPVRSIKDIGTFFRKPWKLAFFQLLDGRARHLDAIEHDILRDRYRDYRIHAAVNCASISCPVLRAEAYVADKLEQQLDDQMRIWLRDPTRNKIEPHQSKIFLSKIFDWYEADFESWGGGLRKVLRTYTPPEFHSSLESHKKIEYLDYNWQLNEAL